MTLSARLYRLSSIYLMIVIFSVFLAGCGKTEESKEAEPVKEEITEQPVETIEEEVVEETQFPSLLGKWEGSGGQIRLTMEVTAQDENSFEGKTVFNSRTPLNRNVKGTVDFETREMRIEDLTTDRYSGKYRGKLSEDLKTFTGTFTNNAGESLQVTLKLKD